MNIMQPKQLNSESGNVLFLILIAVALFAALSYAVTSSTRSGGSDANAETNLVNSSAITQYPASIRTAIVRMIVSNGVDPSELTFNKPPYTNLDTSDQGLRAAVFHPAGGGAIYAPANSDVMADGSQGDWFFHGTLGLEQIGLDSDSDVTAFLPGIRLSVCNKINEELGLPNGPPPTIDTDLSGTYKDNMEDDDTDVSTAPANYASGVADTIEVSTTNTLAGQAFGCFENPTTNEYVYYHVLVER